MKKYDPIACPVCGAPPGWHDCRPPVAPPPASPEYFRTIDPPLVPMTSASPEPVTEQALREALARGARDARIFAGDPVLPASPEPMPDGWECGPNGIMAPVNGSASLTFGELRALLATQGLSIVDAASAKVLEACAAMTIGFPSCAPRPPAKMGPIPKAGVMAVVEAELARRGRKEEP